MGKGGAAVNSGMLDCGMMLFVWPRVNWVDGWYYLIERFGK